MPRGPYPYLQPSVNTTGAQKPQGKVWKAPIPEHGLPVLIKFMARFLLKYDTPYLANLLIAGNKIVRNFTTFGGDMQGKRDMCMYRILAISMNHNFDLYYSQAK